MLVTSVVYVFVCEVVIFLKELGHHISDHDAINKEAISLDCGCSDLNCDIKSTL